MSDSFDPDQMEKLVDEVIIRHTRGTKDPYMVTIYPRKPIWHPRNQELFALFTMWFTSERYEYEENGKYRELMPWFYASMCMLAVRDETDGVEPYEEAVTGAPLEGDEAREYFEECVVKYVDYLIEYLAWMKEEAER